MAIELWATVAASFFASAAVSGGLVHFGVRGPWHRVAVAARAAGAVALTLALVLAVLAHGEPSPLDLQQLGLALALALFLVDLGLSWQQGAVGAAPLQDLVVLSLVLVATLAIQGGGKPLSCIQRSIPFWSQWFLFVLGSGSVLVAGSAALELALQPVLPKSKLRPARPDLHRLAADAAFAALVILGGGLTISVWWAWHTAGSLSGSDPRQAWMAATWLVSAMSLLARHLERRGPRLAAGLAILAAAIALFGLLAVLDLQRLWWTGA